MGGTHIFSGYCQCLNCDAKKSSFLYKSNLIGNTIIREMNSTKEFIQIFDKKYYISDSYLKDLISIDTELFTASTAIILSQFNDQKKTEACCLRFLFMFQEHLFRFHHSLDFISLLL